MLSDQQFLSQLRSQSEAAMLLLVERFYAPIYRYLCRLTGDEQVAAELTQDSFLDAYTALPRLADDSNLSAWLYQIATNRARKHFRRQKLVRWLRLGPLTEPQQPCDEERMVQQDHVSRVLERMPNDYKTCLLLQVWGGLSCAEIGAAVGKSEDAVKMTLARARRRFRELYEEET
ncbi:MAG: RNA polymerase sigma factor [Chloroflexaceae bacterium]|jgi:RNA polymerase sigma-70 factor (ECF subfamily)|nr:RNA polymerase sigma factor [Chloroflexaceae bacterium]